MQPQFASTRRLVMEMEGAYQLIDRRDRELRAMAKDMAQSRKTIADFLMSDAGGDMIDGIRPGNDETQVIKPVHEDVGAISYCPDGEEHENRVFVKRVD